MHHKFQPVFSDKVKEMTTKSLNKSCDLDPVLRWLLKKGTSEVLPPIMDVIINKSVAELVVPSGKPDLIVCHPNNM